MDTELFNRLVAAMHDNSGLGHVGSARWCEVCRQSVEVIEPVIRDYIEEWVKDYIEGWNEGIRGD